jgi:putative transposase
LRSIPATYFVTVVIGGRRALLQNDAHATLLSKLIFDFRDEGRYFLHAFVVMPDHLHLLITPSYDHSVERCVECIKGGFSRALGKDSRPAEEIWQKGFHEHRIRHSEDFVVHISYIAQNPERWGLREHKHVHAHGPQLDTMPKHLGS